MPRPQRIQFPMATYHIMARGNAGADVFLDDEDREAFTEMIADAAKKFDWRIHAWCLMGNHFHLLLTTQKANLSSAMHWFNSTYCQRYNRRHQRRGHVFQGRYKALLVQSDAYLVSLYRYILRNPVAAGLTPLALEYEWSSARVSARKRPPNWMDLSALNAQLRVYTGDRETRLGHFLAVDEPRPIPKKARIYADDEDLSALIEKLPMATDLPPVQAPIETYAREGEKAWISMARAVCEGKHRGADVARHYRVYASTVTRAVARYTSTPS